jgi:hypothetical protein
MPPLACPSRQQGPPALFGHPGQSALQLFLLLPPPRLVAPLSLGCLRFPLPQPAAHGSDVDTPLTALVRGGLDDRHALADLSVEFVARPSEMPAALAFVDGAGWLPG